MRRRCGTCQKGSSISRLTRNEECLLVLLEKTSMRMAQVPLTSAAVSSCVSKRGRPLALFLSSDSGGSTACVLARFLGPSPVLRGDGDACAFLVVAIRADAPNAGPSSKTSALRMARSPLGYLIEPVRSASSVGMRGSPRDEHTVSPDVEPQPNRGGQSQESGASGPKREFTQRTIDSGSTQT